MYKDYCKYEKTSNIIANKFYEQQHYGGNLIYVYGIGKWTFISDLNNSQRFYSHVLEQREREKRIINQASTIIKYNF